MRSQIGCSTLLLLVLGTSSLQAQAPPVSKSAAVEAALDYLNGTSVSGLAGAIRGFLATSLPANLYTSEANWGHQEQKKVVSWTKKKGLYVPEMQMVAKNDGVWRKCKVEALALPDTLVFDIRQMQKPDPSRLTCQLFVAFDARVEAEQQSWKTGIRLYSTSTTIRLRAKLTGNCEITSKLEPGKDLLPDMVFRIRLTDAKLSYDNLKVDHIAGVGGEAAKLLGDTVKGSLDKLAPELEKQLLSKAESALVKAGDTKEVRVSLSKIFAGK